jgi:hypothetical protein
MNTNAHVFQPSKCGGDDENDTDVDHELSMLNINNHHHRHHHQRHNNNSLNNNNPPPPSSNNNLDYLMNSFSYSNGNIVSGNLPLKNPADQAVVIIIIIIIIVGIVIIIIFRIIKMIG